MITLGFNSGSHDAAITLLHDNEIIFAGHAERYSRIKNDPYLNSEIIADCLSYGIPDQIAYYEKPWLKKTRQAYSGQWSDIFNDPSPKQMLRDAAPWANLDALPLTTFSHHKSHAAAGFQTSPFDDATILIIDAIGEWETITIWDAWYDKNGRAVYKKLWRQVYPHSIGLMYSAMTEFVGLKPNEEEYIFMGMAPYGNHTYNAFDKIKLHAQLLTDDNKMLFKHNFHLGFPYSPNWSFNELEEKCTVARSVQEITEGLIDKLLTNCILMGKSSNLVYGGGVALNCCANAMLGNFFENVWILPNPGDAGSSLGAAALKYGKKLNWQDPYLGTNIPGDYPIDEIISELLMTGVVGVASGRAEFGPRALGNRSLLADPRDPNIQEKVNTIKQREQFRPFAPAILEEFVLDYFNIDTRVAFNVNSYMQVTAYCFDPTAFPGIVHVDNTSRVQVVRKDCKSGLRKLLEAWYVWTGCPMLLNTSLNVKGEPMVNDREDADRFEKIYKVKVIS